MCSRRACIVFWIVAPWIVGLTMPSGAFAFPTDVQAQIYVQVVDAAQPVPDLTAENFEARQRGKSIPVLDAVEVDSRQWIFFYDTTFGDGLLPAALEASVGLLRSGLLAGDRVGAVVYSIPGGEGSGGSGRAQLKVLEPTDELDFVIDALALLGSEGKGDTTPRGASDPRRSSRRGSSGSIGDLVRALDDAAKLLGSGSSNHVLVFSGAFDLSVELGGDLGAARERESAALRSEATASTNVPRRDSKVRRTSRERLDGGVVESLQNIDRGGCSLHAVRVDMDEANPSARAGTEGDERPSLFAEATGGETFRVPQTLVESIAPLLARTRSGYRLTLQPRKSGGDGRFSEVEIRLVGGTEGAELVAPDGYYE